MDIFQQIFTVLSVLGILGALLWVLRQKGLARFQFPARGGSARRLEIIERLPLTPQHTVCLLRVDGTVLTVGLSPAGCQVISMDRKND